MFFVSLALGLNISDLMQRALVRRRARSLKTNSACRIETSSRAPLPCAAPTRPFSSCLVASSGKHLGFFSLNPSGSAQISSESCSYMEQLQLVMAECEKVG